MTFPPAPWTLCGHGLQTLQPVDSQHAQAWVPPELDIISVWPGKTLGGIYVASYTADSVLVYNELIIVAALVRYGHHAGAWISHIYVDNPDSVAGGRELWGLPKELAEFSWEPGTSHRVTVRQDQRLLCSLQYDRPGFAWPQPFMGSSLSQLESPLLFFSVEAQLRIGLTRGIVEIPATSPFAALNLDQPWLTVRAEDLNLKVNAPEVIGPRVTQQRTAA